MSVVLAVVAAMAPLWLLGSLVTSALRIRDPNSPERGFHDFAAGFTVLAFLGMTTIAAGGHVSFLWMYLALVLIGILAFAAGGRPGGWGLVLPRGRNAKLLLGICGALLVFFAVGTLGDRMLWDAWAFWTLKAHALFLHGTIPPEMSTLDGPYPWTHPEYPLGVPLLDWWIFRHYGAPATVTASFAGSIWLVILTLVVWQSLAREVPHVWAAAVALGTVMFWPMTMLALGGYAEVLITLAILGVTLELARHGNRLPRAAVLRIGLLLSFAAVAKNEGQALILVASLVVVWTLWRSGSRDVFAYLALAIPGLVIAPWILHIQALGVSAEQVGASLPLSRLLARIPFLVATFFELFVNRAWIGVGLVLIAGLIARMARGKREKRAAWAFVLGYFLVTQAVLLFTPLDLEWLVIDTYFRLIGTMAPAAIYLSVREIALLGTESGERAGSGAREMVGA